MNRIANYLNALAPEDAHAALLKCCASLKWATAMVNARPFATDVALLEEADRIWFSLDQQDWLEAFAGHPRIGDRAKAENASTAKWSSQEQAGMGGASDTLASALSEGNRAYEARFGYVFLICATGRRAQDMLSSLHERLHNTPEQEMRNAGEQQALITRLRLAKLVDA